MHSRIPIRQPTVELPRRNVLSGGMSQSTRSIVNLYPLLLWFLCNSIGVHSFCIHGHCKTSRQNYGLAQPPQPLVPHTRTGTAVETFERNMALKTPKQHPFNGCKDAWLSVKLALQLTYGQRKLREQALKSGMKEMLQQCQNFLHGAHYVIVNFDSAVLHCTLPAILCKLIVTDLAVNALTLYRVYWVVLNSLFYVSEFYDVVARSVYITIGVPMLVGFVAFSVAISTLFLDLLSAVGVKFAALSTLAPAASAFVQTDTFSNRLNLFITCFSGPFTEEVFFRLIPAFFVAALFRRRSNRKGLLSENKFALRFCSLFSVIFGAAHVGNEISLGQSLADTSLSSMQSVTQVVFAAGFFASHALLPLYRSRGLAAAFGAHAAWNALVSFSTKKFLFRLLLVSALYRLAREKS